MVVSHMPRTLAGATVRAALGERMVQKGAGPDGTRLMGILARRSRQELQTSSQSFVMRVGCLILML